MRTKEQDLSDTLKTIKEFIKEEGCSCECECGSHHDPGCLMCVCCAIHEIIRNGEPCP